MARVLIAWELGEGFGHLAQCLRLAEGLACRGHGVTLVLKDVRLPAGQAPIPGTLVLPAPLTPHVGAQSGPPVNYADVLRVSGFGDARDVAARLNAWNGILSLTQPDVLVADHAPTAVLAARFGNIPHLTFGNGFVIPPNITPWPSIRPWEVVPEQSLFSAEARLDRVIDAARTALGYNATVRMRDLFGSHDILDTFAELDHHGARADTGNYVGPIFSESHVLRVAWQSQDTPRVLAYLRPAVPGFEPIMRALSKLDADVLCVAHGLNAQAARLFATRNLRIALAPVDLPRLLAQADMAVTYGNSVVSTQALLAGVPLVMRPHHVEQALFAHRVEAMGAGKLLDGRIEANGVAASLQEVLTNPSYTQAALAFRDRHAGFSPSQAIEHSLAVIERAFLDGFNPDRTRTN